MFFLYFFAFLFVCFAFLRFRFLVFHRRLRPLPPTPRLEFEAIIHHLFQKRQHSILSTVHLLYFFIYLYLSLLSLFHIQTSHLSLCMTKSIHSFSGQWLTPGPRSQFKAFDDKISPVRLFCFIFTIRLVSNLF